MKNGSGSVKIENGIPIPPHNKIGLLGAMRSMKVGQSVLKTSGGYVTNYLTLLKPRKFTQRKVEGGIRIWRIA